MTDHVKINQQKQTCFLILEDHLPKCAPCVHCWEDWNVPAHCNKGQDPGKCPGPKGMNEH